MSGVTRAAIRHNNARVQSVAGPHQALPLVVSKRSRGAPRGVPSADDSPGEETRSCPRVHAVVTRTALCEHAQPAVIVLGEGQGTFLRVCAAKHKCERHCPKPVETTEADTPVEKAEANLARLKEEEAERAKREVLERWRNEGRPRALHLFVKQAASLKSSPKLLEYVIDTINEDPDLGDVLGPIEKIPVRRYPQAVAASLALDHSWYPEPLIDFARALGISLNLESADEAPREAQASESTPSIKRRASQKRKKR